MICAYPEVAKALIEADSDANAKSLLGNTPLMPAIGQVDVPMVKLILAHGGDPGIQNAEGRLRRTLATNRGKIGSCS